MEYTFTLSDVNSLPNTYSHCCTYWTAYLVPIFIGPVLFTKQCAIDSPIIIDSQLGPQLTTFWAALCSAEQHALSRADHSANSHTIFSAKFRSSHIECTIRTTIQSANHTAISTTHFSA